MNDKRFTSKEKEILETNIKNIIKKINEEIQPFIRDSFFVRQVCRNHDIVSLFIYKDGISAIYQPSNLPKSEWGVDGSAINGPANHPKENIFNASNEHTDNGITSYDWMFEVCLMWDDIYKQVTEELNQQRYESNRVFEAFKA